MDLGIQALQAYSFSLCYCTQVLLSEHYVICKRREPYIIIIIIIIIIVIIVVVGARGSVVLKTPCCNPEGHGFDTRCGDF
jgi:hypothetical protein